MSVRAFPVRALVLVVTFGGSWLVGCSSFSRDWETYMPIATPQRPAESESPAATLPVGRWAGTWTSEASGHHGSLRCIVTRVSDHRVRARFRAVYAGFIPYERTVMLDGVGQFGLWRFEGEEDLGFLAGGRFRFEGEASRDRFFASYRTHADQGVFEMNRAR